MLRYHAYNVVSSGTENDSDREIDRQTEIFLKGMLMRRAG
jgi:hypothetical protein